MDHENVGSDRRGPRRRRQGHIPRSVRETARDKRLADALCHRVGLFREGYASITACAPSARWRAAAGTGPGNVRRTRRSCQIVESEEIGLSRK